LFFFKARQEPWSCCKLLEDKDLRGSKLFFSRLATWPTIQTSAAERFRSKAKFVLFKPLEATLLVPPLLAFAISFDCFRMLRAVVRKIVGMSLAPLLLAVVAI